MEGGEEGLERDSVCVCVCVWGCVVVMQKQTTGLRGHPRLLAELLLLTDYIT